MNKKIVAVVVVIMLTTGIIFAKIALADYYVTDSGQKIGYNRNEATHSNYYSLGKTKIPSTNNPNAINRPAPADNTSKAPDIPVPDSPSTDYIKVGNQKIYYNNSSQNSSNHYKVEIGRRNTNSGTGNQQPPVEIPADSTVYELSTSEKKLIDLINQERTDAGLNPLIVDSELCRVARIKAEDLYKNNYFSHTSPTYESPFQMMRDFGISFKSAAENIAKTYGAESAHNGFMNSPGHRNNILNPGYTHVGVGIYGKYYVEMFIRK